MGILVADVVAFLALLAVVPLYFLVSPNVVSLWYVVVSVPLIWVFSAFVVKRLRDAGLSPWLGLLVLVPLVGLVVFLVIGFKPTAVPRPDATTSI